MGDQDMSKEGLKPEHIKFIAADSSVLLILLILLFRHFSIIGLVSFIIGGVLLFLGTLLDKNKALYGVSCKLSYIVFITGMILMLLWLPSLLKNNNIIVLPPEFSTPALLFSIGFFVLSVIAGMQKNYIARRVFKYLGLASLFTGASLFMNLPITCIISFCMIIMLFGMCDIFSCKFMIKRKNEFNHEANPDRAYWMAVLICLSLGFAFVYSGTYVGKFIGDLKKVLTTLNVLTGGLKIPVFALLMITLSVVFIMVDKNSEYANYSDTYLSTSLFGFSIVLFVFSKDYSWYSFALLIISVIICFCIGMSTISNEVFRINPQKIHIKQMLKNDGIAIGISAFVVFGIVFIKAGFLVSFVTLIILIPLVYAACKGFKGLWVADALRWQSGLVAITLFSISLSIVSKSISSSLLYIIPSFIIISLITWALSVRKGEWDNTGMTIPKILNCILLAVISIVAAV